MELSRGLISGCCLCFLLFFTCKVIESLDKARMLAAAGAAQLPQKSVRLEAHCRVARNFTDLLLMVFFLLLSASLRGHDC